MKLQNSQSIKKVIQHKNKKILVFRDLLDGKLVMFLSHLKGNLGETDYKEFKEKLIKKNWAYKKGNRYYVLIDKLTYAIKQSRKDNYLTSVRTTVSQAIKKSMSGMKFANPEFSNILTRDSYVKDTYGRCGRAEFLKKLKVCEANLYGKTIIKKLEILSKIKSVVIGNDNLKHEEKISISTILDIKIINLKGKIKNYYHNNVNSVTLENTKFVAKTDKSFKTYKTQMSKKLLDVKKIVTLARGVKIHVTFTPNETKKSSKINGLKNILNSVCGHSDAVQNTYQTVGKTNKLVVVKC